MAQAAAQSVVRAVAARKCKAHALVRLADEVAPQLSSVQGRRVSAGLPQCRALRGRSGFGRRSRKGADRKLGKLNVSLGRTLRATYGRSRLKFSLRSEGAVAGVGLFTNERIRKRAVLGVFTGQEISRAEAQARRAQGAKCLVQFRRDGVPVYLDGSKGKTSLFSWVNSSRGTKREPNSEFVVIDRFMAVQTLRVVERDTELLVDYDWVRPFARSSKLRRTTGA
jgi:hypothetical protein